MKMNGPFQFELKIYAINEESNSKAVLRISMPPGVYTDAEQIKEYLKKGESVLPEGYRLMNKSEFVNELFQDECGALPNRFATPGNPDFEE